MSFVHIPPGNFLMGSSNGYGDEKPTHKVNISAGFLMGVHQVTQAQYEKVTVLPNPSYFQPFPNRPVEQVSWFGAVSFCNKLSQQFGLRPFYSIGGNKVAFDFFSDGFRLPSEAEWEYSCRSGSTTEYFWGDSVDGEYLWYYENSDTSTHDVGTRRPNFWNLYDMCGNVWEWCNDWHGPYSSEEQTDPKGPKSGVDRILRGGSWYYNYGWSGRSADRGRAVPTLRSYIFGFRVCRYSDS